MMGLASGMDTDFIIQQTLRMHQFKIDNHMRNKKLIEWRQQTHNSIKDEITTLRGTFLSNLGSKSMMNRNVFNATKATITGKNASAVSVTTLTGTPTGKITIGHISSLAKGANITSGSSVSLGGTGFNPNTRLDSLNFRGEQQIIFENFKASVKNAAGETTTIARDSLPADLNDLFTGADVKTELKVGGNSYEIVRNGDIIQIYEAGTATLKETFDLGSAEDNKATFNIDGAAFTIAKDGEDIRLNGQRLNFYQEAIIGSGDSAVSLRKSVDNGVIANDGKALEFIGETSMTVNGKEITIFSNDTITTMLNKVNSSGAGVTMSYSRLTDRFTIEHNTVGSKLDEDLIVTGTGNLLEMLSGSGPISTDGSLAKVIINDEEVESRTNTFEYRGLRITLNSTTEENDEETTVTFTRDATPALNAIKDFINSYNAIIKRLEGLLSERKSSTEVGYKPLTDEEKLGMSDKQIDEWEAIARKGILRGDNGIQNLVSNLRRSFFENIEGMGMSASQLGLTTGSLNEGTGGQIIINEERLRAALEADPDRVADIFVKIDTSGDSPRGVGLLHKLDGYMRDFVNTSQSVSIKSLEDSLKRANEQIQKMQERMYAEEDKLYRQFAAMESAMQKLQQQGGWFSAMLGQ